MYGVDESIVNGSPSFVVSSLHLQYFINGKMNLHTRGYQTQSAIDFLDIQLKNSFLENSSLRVVVDVTSLEASVVNPFCYPFEHFAI